jgi:hypothetical protein
MNIRAIFTVDRVVLGYTPPQPVISSHLKQNLTANDPNAPVVSKATPGYPGTVLTSGQTIGGEPVHVGGAAYPSPPAGYTAEEIAAFPAGGPAPYTEYEPAVVDGVLQPGPVAPILPEVPTLNPGEFAMNCGNGRTLIGTLSFQVRNPELTPSGLTPGAVHYVDIQLND